MPSTRTLLAACLLSSGLAAQAQDRAPAGYRGIVVAAATLQPMAGATVINRTRRLQVQSDEQGRFELPAAPQDTLSVSFVGYETKLLILPAGAEASTTGVVLLRTKEAVLPGVTVRNTSPAAFGRDFVNTDVPIQKPMRFWDSASFHATMNSVPGTAGESAIRRAQAQHDAAARNGQVGQVTLVNFVNVFRWLRRKKSK